MTPPPTVRVEPSTDGYIACNFARSTKLSNSLPNRLLRRNGKVELVNNLSKAVNIDVISVKRSDRESVSEFFALGRKYLNKLCPEEQERFLQSILARQGEPDRWLLLLKHRKKHVGFAHVKIDKDERSEWDFILEFYILPTRRRTGLGRAFFNFIVDVLRDKGVKDVWLLAGSSEASSFWRSLGFRSTGEIDKETGQIIMARSLNPAS
jgi:GNAT superfamily N-acetyltransferase